LAGDVVHGDPEKGGDAVGVNARAVGWAVPWCRCLQRGQIDLCEVSG
jgi:hypothetical protein